MSSPEVLPKPPIGNSSSYETDSDDDDAFSGAPSKPLSTVKTYDAESSISKLPGTSLLRSVHHKQAMSSNHDSIKSLKSDHTYDFNKKNGSQHSIDVGYDGVDEFGEDVSSPPIPVSKKQLLETATSSSSAPKPPRSARVPAWKLRHQALRSEDPPPPKNIISSENTEKPSPLRMVRKTNSFNKHGSPVRALRKTRSGNSSHDSTEQGWFKKLTTKKETPEEKEKRIKSEALIRKQDSTRWGKDILEEDSSEEPDDEEDKKEKETIAESSMDKEKKESEKDEDESDTVKKVTSLLAKSFGSALISTIKKDKEAEKDEEENDEDDNENSTSNNPSPKKASGRGNRWAMMGSAAMTSVRNMQKGWGDDNDETGKTTEPIAEGDDEDDDEKKLNELVLPDENTNRRSLMWRNRGAAAFTSVRNAWGGDATSRRRELENGDESSSHADDVLSKSFHSYTSRLDQEAASSSDNKDQQKQKNLFFSIGNFLQHTRARFDPEVWADPKIQESVAAIEKLRTKLNESRNVHKHETRRRERQIENSITQQKTFLARKLARQMYGYKRDPFHPCIKDVYEKEILIIVHEATSLGGDDDSQVEKDGIDALLDSQKFDFDYIPEESTDDNKSNDGLGAFFGRSKEKGGDTKRGENSSVAGSLFSADGSTFKVVGHDSVVPLETRLIRAQHNEWMTDHQMEFARSFQQKSVEHLYDILPELRKDHEKLKAIPQLALDAKIKELEASNNMLKESYQAHVEAQEKLLAIYRERYVPSVHEDENGAEKNDDTEEKDTTTGKDEDDFNSPKSIPKRPSMWGKKLGQSVRGLFGPKMDNENEETNNAEDDDSSEGNSSRGGFELASPLTGGSDKKKFLLSFGSPSSSKAASGILANFAAPSLGMGPPLTSTNSDDDTDAKQSHQDSAKDSAAAAWTVPKMDKASLPESLAEKRAKRAAARKASRPDAPSASSRKAANGTAVTASSSRSELLQRARKARQESAAAMGTSAPGKLSMEPMSATPSSRTGRSSLRSNTASTRKQLSMKDLMAAAGDSRRKLKENDSRMERLTHKKNQLQKESPLVSPGASMASSRERRLRISRELRNEDDPLSISSQHSLHERKPRARSLKKASHLKDEDESEEQVHEILQDVDEFGGEERYNTAR